MTFSRMFAAGLLLGAACPLAARAANPVQIEVCPSQQKAEQFAGSQGKFTPDGCRIFTVTRVESQSGAMCVMDLNPDKQGVLASIVDATMPTQWWTACTNIRGP